MHLKPRDYRIYYVNIDLRHQYGISVAESQTFLLAKRPSAAMSEEKRLSFAGYESRLLCDLPKVLTGKTQLLSGMLPENFVPSIKALREYLV